jgi:class 3 adenylate cyclase
MQDETRRYGDRLRSQGRAPVEIRIGINTGEVVVREVYTGGGHAEYTPIGHTTNLAARLQSLARSSSVVVSEMTEKLVAGYFQLKSLGPVQIKGVSEALNLYEVTGLGPLRTAGREVTGDPGSKTSSPKRIGELCEVAAPLRQRSNALCSAPSWPP